MWPPRMMTSHSLTYADQQPGHLHEVVSHHHLHQAHLSSIMGCIADVTQVLTKPAKSMQCWQHIRDMQPFND